MRNVRLLLKGGGALILYETITPQAILPGYIFGLLPGWWLSDECDRSWTPLSSETGWDKCLRNTGFSGATISLMNKSDISHLGGCALISVAVEEPGPQIVQNVGLQIALITRDVSSLHYTLAEQLISVLEDRCGRCCVILTLSELSPFDFDCAVSIFLPELDTPFLNGIPAEHFILLQKIISRSKGILWLTNEDMDNPTNQMIQGLARCVREEYKNLRFITLSLKGQEQDFNARHILQVLHNSLLSPSSDFEGEFVEKDQMLWIKRVTEARDLNFHLSQQTNSQALSYEALGEAVLRPLRLEIARAGMLDSLRWVDESRARLPLADYEVEIQVMASGLNFRDVLVALGQVSADSLGGEGAGIVTRASRHTGFAPGDRVVSLIGGSFTSFGRGHYLTTAKIPDDMLFSTAAALPIIFCTDLYCLKHWPRMSASETILIHSAAGGFGQAAIQIAKLYNAEIFATVGSDEKRQVLSDLYGIPDDHIYSSRSQRFVSNAKKMTKGKGVDVILNSLSGEGLRGSWECIAPLGRFIEVGKRDVYNFGNLANVSICRERDIRLCGFRTPHRCRSADSWNVAPGSDGFGSGRTYSCARAITFIPYFSRGGCVQVHAI